MTSQAERLVAEVPLRRNREFRLLWVGQALSDFGSSMTGLALPLALLAAGYPASAAGLIGTVILVVGLAVRIPAGFLADRFDQRGLMLACDLVRLAAVTVVAVYAFLGPLPLAIALGLVVVSGGAREVFLPSQNKMVRRIVPVGQLEQAVALNQARAYGSSIAAPAAAGLLIVVSTWLPFAVDALTFGLSALCVAMLSRNRVRGDQVPLDTGVTPERFLSRLVAGWRYLVKDRFLRWSSLYFALMNLVFSALSYALILGAAGEPGGAAAVGIAMSSAAVAGLAGSLLMPFVARLLSLRVMLAAGPALSAVLLIVAWWGGGTIPFVAAFCSMCLLTPVIGGLLSTIMAKTVPEAIYGRVTTATSFVAQVLQPGGPLAAGLLLTQMSLGAAAGLFAVALGALAVLTVLLPPATGPNTTEPVKGRGKGSC